MWAYKFTHFRKEKLMNNKKTVRVVSDLVTFKITSAETGGAYSLFETQTPPQAGSPRHIEHREEEAFLVLEGEYTFAMSASSWGRANTCWFSAAPPTAS